MVSSNGKYLLLTSPNMQNQSYGALGKKKSNFLFSFSCHVVCPCSLLPAPFDSCSVKRTAKSSSALMTAPPNSPTWSSWWSSTSSTEGCCLVNSNTRAPSWPYDIFGSSDPRDPYHLTWLCLKQTKQQEPFCWLVVFVISMKSWWIDWCFVVVILYCHESTGDCWLVGFVLVCMDVWGVGCTTCSWGSSVKKREDKEKQTLPFESMLLQNLPQSCCP